MGQRVYVLTTLVEKKIERPVAVVDEMHLDAANQWANASKNNDWVPLEMNDMSLTGLGDMPTDFKPVPPSPVEDTMRELQETNTQLIDLIRQLAERYKDKNVLKLIERMKKQSSFSSELLRSPDGNPNP